MHPILGNVRRLRVFAIAWPAVGLAVGWLPFRWAGGPPRDAWAVIAWGQAMALPALASWYVCRFAPIGTAGAPRMFSTIGASAVLTAGLWLGTGRLWLWAVSPVAPTPDALFAQLAPAAFTGAAIVFVLMTAVHYALAASDEGRAAAARALEAEIAARETQLRALRAQVNPHFLFNCLHSISALVGQDPTNARRMCLELAEFFRESLRAGAQSHVPLVTEAALVRRYLEIERVRFGDRLRATVDVAADVEQTLVPPLLLQPLAENAVKHGIATLVDGGDITIAISRRGDRVEVSVENPYDAAERPAGNGMGLANVRARLDASYEGRATFRVQAADGRFRAAISLPFETTA